jgi:hypothetical protein
VKAGVGKEKGREEGRGVKETERRHGRTETGGIGGIGSRQRRRRKGSRQGRNEGRKELRKESISPITCPYYLFHLSPPLPQDGIPLHTLILSLTVITLTVGVCFFEYQNQVIFNVTVF